jgi:hypothetical protein
MACNATQTQLDKGGIASDKYFSVLGLRTLEIPLG